MTWYVISLGTSWVCTFGCLLVKYFLCVCYVLLVYSVIQVFHILFDLPSGCSMHYWICGIKVSYYYYYIVLLSITFFISVKVRFMDLDVLMVDIYTLIQLSTESNIVSLHNILFVSFANILPKAYFVWYKCGYCYFLLAIYIQHLFHLSLSV